MCVCVCVCVCVIVAELIQITVQPQSQQATAGSRVVLTCRASGPPGLGYQWFRGKEEVSPTLYVYVTIEEKKDLFLFILMDTNQFLFR